MSTLRCEGCSARWPNTPEGHAAADAHIKRYHSPPTLMFILYPIVVGLLGGLIIRMLRG